MITKEDAIEIAQKTNRNLWLNDAIVFLNKKIITAAQKGKREVVISLVGCIIGAETLSECAELLLLLSNEISKRGFTHKILPNGQMLIKW